MIRRPVDPSKALKRPYATHYFNSTRDVSAAFTSTGAAASEQGAIRASVVRLFLGQYEKCIIYDRYTGVPIYNLKRKPGGGFSIGFGSGVGFKAWEKP